jgi:D-alanyl-D-alanine carboxypeptidase
MRASMAVCVENNIGIFLLCSTREVFGQEADMINKTRSTLTTLAVLFLLGGCSSSHLTATPPASTPTLNPVTPTLIPATPTLIPATPTLIPFTPTLTPTSPSPTPRPVDNLDELIAIIEGLAAQDQFSGSILVARDAEVLWQYAAGLADREADIPNRVDTQYNLGSMNKMFTAIAILQMLEQGKLSLDDTIAEHLPDYPNPEVASQVTIHQLLMHTSGLGDTFTEEFGTNPNQYRSNEDYLPLFVNEPLLFAPGERFSYSNAGYVVLGLMIEALSDQSYDDYVRVHIFEPSGMVSTGAHNIEEDVPNLAIGYTTKDIDGNDTGVLASHTALMPGRGFAAGGGYSTVEDLFLFRNALLGYQLLSPESTDLLITGKVYVREYILYAYGFFDRLELGQRVIGHTGGAPGVCSFLSMYLESGYTVAVLSNSDNDCREVLNFLGYNPSQ